MPSLRSLRSILFTYLKSMLKNASGLECESWAAGRRKAKIGGQRSPPHFSPFLQLSAAFMTNDPAGGRTRQMPQAILGAILRINRL